MAFHFVCTSCSNRCDKSHSITDACSGVDQIHGDKCQYCPARLRSLRIRSTAGGAAGSTVAATVLLVPLLVVFSVSSCLVLLLVLIML